MIIWQTYICEEEHEDTPFMSGKDEKVYYWTLAYELPDYPYVSSKQVLTLGEAQEWWQSQGYEPMVEEP